MSVTVKIANVAEHAGIATGVVLHRDGVNYFLPARDFLEIVEAVQVTAGMSGEALNLTEAQFGQVRKYRVRKKK